MFLTSPEFCQYAASVCGGICIGFPVGWKACGWWHRRKVRPRKPEYIPAHIVNLTCDRRHVKHNENAAEGIDWLFKNR